MEECKNEIIEEKESKEEEIEKESKEEEIEKESNSKRKKMNKLMKEYLETFDEKELCAYKIAQEHLQSSFSLEKSIGFNKWLKDRG